MTSRVENAGESRRCVVGRREFRSRARPGLGLGISRAVSRHAGRGDICASSGTRVAVRRDGRRSRRGGSTRAPSAPRRNLAPGHALSVPAFGNWTFARARLSPAFAQPRAHGIGAGRDNGRRASPDARPCSTTRAPDPKRLLPHSDLLLCKHHVPRLGRNEKNRATKTDAKARETGRRDGTSRDARRKQECTNRTEARAVARGRLADATRSERAKGRIRLV